MKTVKILILGYSSFARRRVIPAFKKNKGIKFCICSNSHKIDLKKKIFFNNFHVALKDFNPEIVYISKINSLHFKFAHLALKKNYNVIVDKPVTLEFSQALKLLKIAKKNKLFFAESTLFNYHKVFKKILKECGGLNKIEHIQSNFNIPLNKNQKKLREIKGDCEADMAPYAASIIRIFLKEKKMKIHVFKNYFKNSKLVKSFYITAKTRKITYFGNFAFDREYEQQIIFFTKDKIIYSPKRIFAYPPNRNSLIIVKNRNKSKKIFVKKDDCIDNFFKLVLNDFKKKKFTFFYDAVLKDAKLRNIIRKFR